MPLNERLRSVIGSTQTLICINVPQLEVCLPGSLVFLRHYVQINLTLESSTMSASASRSLTCKQVPNDPNLQALNVEETIESR